MTELLTGYDAQGKCLKQDGSINTNAYNIIKRFYRGEQQEFVATGVWADGHIAYSRVVKNEKGERVINDDDSGAYAQVINTELHRLEMIRI